jgi:Glutamate dehydrogenase/leucine dehydrogenase
VNQKLEKVVTKSFADMVKTQKKYGESGRQIPPRMGAYIVALERVAYAMKLRGWY